jgi:glycosyltransferase involved in cell wall biosynthesis
MDKVSVIIPTYNRFHFLLNTIESIKNQTHKNMEIIVVNDCSTEPEYYNYNWQDIHIIHLPENTKTKFGYACVGHVINCGLKYYTGDYFATCDDDDMWLPNKIELQLKAMRETGCKMSSTDGFIGEGMYNPQKEYKKYNAEHYYQTLERIYRDRGSNLLNNGFPLIWDLNFLKIHNCMIACSVIIHKDIIKKIGKQCEIPMGGTILDNQVVHIDYDYWLRALEHTNSVYVNESCFYYDELHGYGNNY